MKAIIDESHRQNLRAIVHTGLISDAIDVLKSGADGLEHGVTEEGLRDDRLSILLRQRNARYVPTLQMIERLSPLKALPTSLGNLKALDAAGVKFAMGSDTFGDMPRGECSVRELELMVKAGLKPATVVEAATRNAAEYLGISKDVGTIEPGKIADLIIVDGDPLQDISSIRKLMVVVQAGRVVHDVDGNLRD